MTPYDRARRDPAFRERFARAYVGGDDPLDALWWQEHPEESGPSGAPAPALELGELRRAVYSPGGDPATAARYRQVQDGLERRRAAVLEALAAADRAGAQPPTARADPGSDPVTSTDPPARPSGFRRPARAAVAVALAAVVAFAAGVLVSPTLGRGGAAQQPTVRSVTPTPTEAAPFVSGASGTGSALGIFGEPQRDVDRPAIGIGARLLPQTFHRLETVPSRGVDIYAAEDSDGDVCLVALSVEARLSAACEPIAAFRTTPVRLAFRADLYREAWMKTGVQVEMVATWGFFSRFTLQETPVGKR